MASSPFDKNEQALEYGSPAMPAASVEGLCNVAPSVLRLLQICGEEVNTWKGLIPGGERPTANGLLQRRRKIPRRIRRTRRLMFLQLQLERVLQVMQRVDHM